MKRYVLLGNFGDENFGDEAVLQAYTDRFTDVEWFVVSHNPKPGQYARLPAGLRSLFAPWHKTLKAYWQCDGVVYAGGTLFTDAESVWACVLWWLHGLPPIVLRKPIYCAFQGVGPFRSGLARMFAKSIFKRAAYVSVRDSRSYKVLQELCPHKHITLTFDPVILLVHQSDAAYNHSCLVVIPRSNSTDEFIALVKDQLKHDWEEVLILSFQPNSEEEAILCNQLSTLFAKASIYTITSMQEAVQYISSASQVVSQRFHGTLIAKTLGKQVYTTSQTSGDKHAALVAEMADIAACYSRAELGITELQERLVA